MTVPTALGRRLLHLFVDDGPLAAAVIAWSGLVFLALRARLLNPSYAGPLLAAGIAAILAHNLHRAWGRH